MLTLVHLKLGLRDLLDKRAVDLHKSKAGAFHAEELKEHLDGLEALPPALTGGAPLTAELERVDAKHDGFGGAIWFATEVYARLPGAEADVVEAASRIRAAFVPELGELQAAYAVEADRAVDRRPLLKSLKADLQAIPVAGGGTLHDVATAFLDAGDELEGLLSQRADAMPRGSRKRASALRSTTIGLLNRLRADLAKEVGKNAKLPRDLEARVFGYFDTLGDLRGPGAGKRAAKPAPAPADPKPPAPGG